MRGLAFVILIFITGTLFAEETPSINQTDLFVRGEYGTKGCRIPALIVTNSGVVIAISDARMNHGGDLPNNIDLVMRRSYDNGETWEAQTKILDLPGDHGAGDASLIVDHETGRLFCLFVYGPPGIGINNSKPGSNSISNSETLHVQIMHSDDDGTTWSEPRDMNSMIKSPEWEGIFAASGHGICTSKGRLIQPYVIRYSMDGSKKLQTHARNAYSDDHGLTWSMGGVAGLQIGESKIVELPDGRLMQNMRNRSLKRRSISISLDGAESFGEMWQDSTLIDPRCNASIAVYDKSVVMFSNPASLEGRENMTVRFSYDNAKSWPVSRVVWAGPTAYSSIVELPDGSIGLLYERGDKGSAEKITFAKFNREWVEEPK